MHTLFCGMPSCYCSIRQTNKKITCFVFLTKWCLTEILSVYFGGYTLCTVFLWYCMLTLLHVRMAAPCPERPFSQQTFWQVISGKPWVQLTTLTLKHTGRFPNIISYLLVTQGMYEAAINHIINLNHLQPFEFRIKQWVSHSGKF